jgi:hypothetical protein
MIKELESTDKYVYVSRIDKFSEVYDLELDYPVIINNEANIAKNIKLGDNISFFWYSSSQKKSMEKCFEVKFIGFSKFPSSCFSGNCLIKTILGMIPVSKLHIGDIVITPLKETSRIKCILETKINRQIDMMTHSDGLVITGFHPVKINNKWYFPNNLDIFEKKNIYIDSIYSIGLERGTSFIVNGIEVAGLGHGVLNDDVLSHPYFGSNLVIEDILRLAPNSHCVIEPEQIIRNNDTGLVCGIIKK